MHLIRNFSIIAHIDHGKSTLADRFIQRCGGLAEREMGEQVLDSMDLERERGITIKAQTAALTYKARDGQIYNLNLIDTPGHVDFAYEVSRSLAACEGALLVVDASQGVEAQTVANCYTAIEQGVTVVPVLNKIDLPSAEPDRVIEEIEDIIGIPAHDALRCSAKTGEGLDDVLEAVIARIPPPKGDPELPLQALIIDSWFDNYVGVVMLVRVMQGTLKPRDKILLMAVGATYNCEQVGVFTPKSVARESLSAGEVGFIIAGIKEIHAAKVGDTVTLAHDARRRRALPGFKDVKPQVFAGLYPVESNQYEALRDALDKAQAQRRVASLRARSLAGAGLRLSLRVPGPPAHGHRAGAARARVRHGPDHDGADRDLRDPVARRHRRRDRKSVEAAGPVARRGDPRADHHDDDADAAGIRRPGDHALHRAARRRRRTCSTSAGR